MLLKIFDTKKRYEINRIDKIILFILVLKNQTVVYFYNNTILIILLFHQMNIRVHSTSFINT